MTLDKDTLLHNRYRIVEILGQGGMGSVYRAVDENLGVVVAIKENLFTTDEYARQFRLEAVILANLRHPNLPRVSDHFVLGDMGQYLVMDYIEGEDLRSRMERLGMLSEEDAVHIGAAICDALAYLHSRKPPILHRDIKPGNVKITPDGHIFLVDFGLAKVYQSASQATTTGARAMTPGYSPPEQYGTARTDPRTDIYSLGATLYAALSGIIPEDGLARAMDNAQLTPLRKRNSKVSRRFAAAIEKAMAVDPSDRFQVAEDFKTALLGSKSKTSQAPGSYTVAPPPPDEFHEDEKQIIPDPVPAKEMPPRKPIQSPTTVEQEQQPFISPLKRQKERERKRRVTLFRFVMLLLVLLAVSVPFLAPGLIPADVRGMIPMLAATETPEPSPIPSPISTQTMPPTFTPMPVLPTNSPTPTNTFIPSVLNQPTATPVRSTALGGGAGQIAFASSRTGVPQIYIADLAEGNAIQITDMQNGACQPSWSPDGLRLVFISPCKGAEFTYFNTSLYVINADGTDLRAIAVSPGGNFDPAWSPDGKLIAFTSMRTGQMEIFTVSVEDDFSTITQITQGAQKFESRMPAWSPRSTQIVYVVKRFEVYQIWMMEADGSEQRQIVRSGLEYWDYAPAWSPNDDLILFNQRCATRFCNPYLMSISPHDRTAEQGKRIPLNIVTIQNVKFSPDGFHLAYEGVGEEGNLDVFYMTIAGGDRVRLTIDKSLDFHPAWRPMVITP